MNSLNIVKVSELRSKLAAIPGKILISVLLLIGMSWDTDFATVWGHAKAQPAVYALNLLLLYGLISYIYFFVRMFHNWLIGVIVAVVVVFLFGSMSDRMDPQMMNLLALVMFFGGPVLDIFRIFRYFSLKKRVEQEGEEFAERVAEKAMRYSDGYDVYEDAYERGFEQGYGRARLDSEREAERRERRRRRERFEEELGEDEGDYIDSEEEDGFGGWDEEERERRERKSRGDGKGHAQEERRGDAFAPAGFFADCRDEAAIKRRYHELCKVYHPDSGNGSEAIFRLVNEEYERLTGN